ncbi:MAG: RDD family protein [Actinomycetota bacterium]
MSNLPPPSSPPPPPPPMGDGYVPAAPASFGQRLGTVIIDGLILGVPFGIVYAIALAAVPTEIVLCQDDTALCEQPTGGGFAVLLLIGLVYVITFLWYIAEFEGRRGATIGRSAMSTKVVRIGTDQPIGAGAAIGRYFARILSGLPCYLGYLWMLWDPQKQTWHDKIVGSQVVKG